MVEPTVDTLKLYQHCCFLNWIFHANVVFMILQGGKECPYYMRIGSCKFATNCRFHHPDPTNVVSRDPVLEHENGDIPQQNVQASSQLNVPVWSADQRALNEHCAPFLAPASSYSAGMIPPRGMYPSPEWSGYHQVNMFIFIGKSSFHSSGFYVVSFLKG